MFPDKNSLSAQLFERASRVIPGGVNRQTISYPPYVAYADKGEGCRITDVDGIERIDFWNNYSAMIHGYNNPGIVNAVIEQARDFMAGSLPTETEIELAELICERLPSIERLRFTNSGTEAVMWAVRTARAHTGRSKIAKAEGSFHGGFDLVETSYQPSAEEWGALESPASVALSKDTPQSVLDEVVVFPLHQMEITQSIIEKHANELAAVIIDPIPSRMAFMEVAHDYLQMLRDVTSRHGIQLIFDEVFSFRAGYHGAQGRSGIKPDLTALGKIIGGGLPVGAFGGSAEVMSVIEVKNGRPPLHHGGTNNANAVVMTAGLASMQQLTEEKFSLLEARGDLLKEYLRDAIKKLDLDMTVQGVGSLTSLVPRKQKVHHYRDLLVGPKEIEVMLAFHRHLLNRGVLIPPICTFIGSTPMTEADIDVAGKAATAALEQIKPLM